MKGKKSKKEEEIPDVCTVCKGSNWNTELYEQLRCINCELVCHKYCYAPDFKEKNKNSFRCDPCKKRHSKGKDKKQQKNHRYSCSHCDSAQGILKQIGGQEWMHVLCALTSNRVHLASYTSLTFSLEAPHARINKNYKCNFCNSDKSQGLRCCIKDCKTYSHLTCVVDHTGITFKNGDYESITTIGLLDKNEGSLKSKILGRKEFPGLSAILKDKKQQKKMPIYLVCQQHNTLGSFIWCTCNTQKSEAQQQIECEQCKRWFHNSCDPGQTICKGCRQNDVFTRFLKLPELISQAVKVEKVIQLDKFSIKFLDHFVFKLSDVMEKTIENKKNSFEIERYFLRQHLQQYNTADLENQKVATDVIEILHYLLRRQVKKESEIGPQNILEMLTELSGKGNKFEWSQQKIQKSEKKYKSFIDSKLKKMMKDPIREVRSKLIQFTKSNKDANRSVKDIAVDLKTVMDLADSSDTWKTLFADDEVKNIKQLIQLFCESGLNQCDVVSILETIKTLQLAKREGVMDEGQYEKITSKQYPVLSNKKAQCLKSIYTNLSKDLKLRKHFESNKELLQQLETQYSNCSPSEKRSIRDKATKSNIVIPSTSEMHKFQSKCIQLEINKRLFNYKFCPPDTNRLHEAVRMLGNILNLNQQVGKLGKEKLHYEALHFKYSFYHSMSISLMNLKKQEMANNSFRAPGMQGVHVMMPFPGMIPQQMLPQDQEQNEPRSQEKLEENLRNILAQWPNTLNATEAALNLLTHVSKKQVPWTPVQVDLLRSFFNLMVLKIDKLVQDSLFTMKSQLLSSIREISQSLGISEQYQNYTQPYQIFMEWKQQLQTSYRNIEVVLEDAEQCKKLIETTDRKMFEAETLRKKIDLSSEIKKLKIMKLWAQFSIKFLVADRSITIAAIQTVKNNMDKIYYPQNRVRKEIQRLDNEGKTLNKRISRFLQKSKIGDFELYEQLKFISSKMTLDQAHQLQKDLKASDLDVQLELNQLIEEIRNVDTLPKDIGQYSRKCVSLSEVSQLRRDLQDSPFIICELQEYEIMLRRYYSLKCQEPTDSCSKKDYFRMLNHGGAKAVDLLMRTEKLHSTYKEIDLAEKQLLGLTSRQKFEHPLPSEFRKIKVELSSDPAELSRVEKYYIQFNRLRYQFNQLKQEKCQIERFLTLQAEITKLPINTTDLVSQITRMKKELEELTSKARPYLPIVGDNQGITYDSPFTHNLVLKYQRLGARCQLMDRFENIVTKMRQVAEMSTIINFENYKPFNVLCERVSELTNNDEFYKARYEAFFKIFPPFLQSEVALFQVGLALLAEGGYLMRRPGTANNILEVIGNINSKFCNWERAIPSGTMRQYRDSEDRVQDAGQQNEDGVDSMQEDDYDSDELEDEEEVILSSGEEGQGQGSGSSSSNEGHEKKIVKRKRPQDVQLIISDDD